MTVIATDLQKQWSALAEPLRRRLAPILTIRTEQEYDQGVARLNELIDEVGTDEAHPLYSLLDTLSIVLQAYEDTHYPIPDCEGADVLAYLLEEHGLSESDLPEIGPQHIVRDILDGQQELEIRQIRALANRFQVSPSAFV